jgi:hypothetical protein
MAGIHSARNLVVLYRLQCYLFSPLSMSPSPFVVLLRYIYNLLSFPSTQIPNIDALRDLPV